MGHNHSKGRSARHQKTKQNARPTIEHLQNFQPQKQHRSQQPNQYSVEHTSYKPSKPRPIRTSKTRTSNHQPYWRDPTPPQQTTKQDEETQSRLTQRSPRTQQRRSHQNDSGEHRGSSYPDTPLTRSSKQYPAIKRNAKSLSPRRLNQQQEFQPRKLKDIAGIPMSKSAPDQVLETSQRRGRSPGRVFCLVRCRSEPTNQCAQLEPYPEKNRPHRKAASASPPRKQSRQNYHLLQDESPNTIYHNDEIAISFEQVEPQTYRVVGGKTTLGPGPVPKTNKIAPRPLRRTFPQLQPKSSQSAKTVSDSKLLIRSNTPGNPRFAQPPIPPRKHRLRDLSHLINAEAHSVQIPLQIDRAPPPPVQSQKHQSPLKSILMSRSYSPTNHIRNQNYRSPSRSPISRSPLSRSPVGGRKQRDDHVGGSIETIESISTQSGSYHLPSSAPYTPNDRSLVDSPFGSPYRSPYRSPYGTVEDVNMIDEALENAMNNPSFDYNGKHEVEDVDINRGRSRTKQDRFRPDEPRRPAEPRPFDPGGISAILKRASNSPRRGINDIQRKSLLWSNPAPFGSYRNSNVIRHVEAPKPKVTYEPPQPVQKYSPAGKYKVDPSKFSGLDKKRSPTRRADQSPNPESNPIRKSIYKEIFETLQQAEDVSGPGPSKTVKSGLPKTYRPSIDQIVRGLSQNAYLRDDSPLRKSVRSHRAVSRTMIEEDRLLQELQAPSHRQLSESGSRTVEVVYVPPHGHQKRVKKKQWYDEPPIIVSDDGHGNNFIDLTRPPNLEQPKLRDSWILPV